MLEWVDARMADGLTLRLGASAAGLRTIEFGGSDAPSGRPGGSPGELPSPTNALLGEAVRQLRAYFSGELREFDLPLDPLGTPFQRRVWSQVAAIPYGETRSYRQVAAAIGSPSAVRAVSAANGANPLPIVVPCHRVIGADGKLVGYGGGLPLKRMLLELEGAPLLRLDGGWHRL